MCKICISPHDQKQHVGLRDLWNHRLQSANINMFELHVTSSATEQLLVYLESQRYSTRETISVKTVCVGLTLDSEKSISVWIKAQNEMRVKISVKETL